MQGLSLVALAGDPSPWRLPAAALDPLVKLMGDLVAGEVLPTVLPTVGLGTGEGCRVAEATCAHVRVCIVAVVRQACNVAFCQGWW
jgi:hypothetical protein